MAQFYKGMGYFIRFLTFKPQCFQTGRSQPHKEDREEFYKSLKTCAAGKMSLQMLYFYKYLVKHSEDDNMPLIDKDLFFYIEVQKFKVRDNNKTYCYFDDCNYIKDKTIILASLSVNVYLYIVFVFCLFDISMYTCSISSVYNVLCNCVFVYLVCVHLPNLHTT